MFSLLVGLPSLMMLVLGSSYMFPLLQLGLRILWTHKTTNYTIDNRDVSIIYVYI